MIEKFFKWLIFGVMIALLPLIFHYFCLFIGKSSPSIGKVVAHGELLIIAVGMTSVAIGDLFSWQTEKSIYKIILGGACTVMLILSALLFAYISSYQTDQSLDINSILNISLLIYIASVISSAFATTITESNL